VTHQFHKLDNLLERLHQTFRRNDPEEPAIPFLIALPSTRNRWITNKTLVKKEKTDKNLVDKKCTAGAY
jgi:hypothetical protein